MKTYNIQWENTQILATEFAWLCEKEYIVERTKVREWQEKASAYTGPRRYIFSNLSFRLFDCKGKLSTNPPN